MPMSDSPNLKLYFVCWTATCLTILSCSGDSPSTSSLDQQGVEYLYAEQCDLSKSDRPEQCASDKPYLIGKYKVGHLYLHIPRRYLQQAADTVDEIYRASHSVCWPSLKLDLTGCPRWTGRILFYMTPGRRPGVEYERRSPRTTRKEEVAKLTEKSYVGPFRIENTKIDEYRRSVGNGAAPVFSFQAEDDVRIARCSNSGWGRCIVYTSDSRGLSIRYEFGVELISEWVEIDETVKSLAASFVVDPDNE